MKPLRISEDFPHMTVQRCYNKETHIHENYTRALWCLKSLVILLFDQQHLQINNEKVKLHITGPLRGKFTGEWRILLRNGLWHRKRFYVIAHQRRQAGRNYRLRRDLLNWDYVHPNNELTSSIFDARHQWWEARVVYFLSIEGLNCKPILVFSQMLLILSIQLIRAWN